MIADWLAQLCPEIDAELERRLATPDQWRGSAGAAVFEAMRYAALGPGKRLRPALVLGVCEALGGTRRQALPAAAAVELLHAYTLVHDDLPALDDDDERRGRPTVHRAFGESTAILAGDALLTAAFAALAELGAHAAAAVGILAARAGAAQLIGGQMLDLALPDNPGLELLQRVHRHKTGALFAAAAELGAIVCSASPTMCEQLGRYGMALGIAFQHADDRDDAEFAEHADEARRHTMPLIDEAVAIAQALGDGGRPLVALAQWTGSRV
jgi:geranylgeranyl pyrophosphate synthase